MTAKRLFDIAFSVVALLALAPLLLMIATAVAVDSPGPVLFRQLRVGRGGAPFRLPKFRTMIAAACDGGGPGLTAADDARLTRVGRWLRRYGLDELPQLLNVLRGDMSVVGPRPELARYVEHYDERERAVLAYRPGLTDPATLRFRDEARTLAAFADPERAYLTTIMRDKVALSLAYAERSTLWSDARVIARTVQALGEGRR